MIDLYIENIQKDLTGVNITENLIILYTNIDISKDDANMLLSVCILNVKTNQTCFLQHDISAISNIYITYSYLFFGVIAMSLICDDEHDFSNNEHGLMYNILTGELKHY